VVITESLSVPPPRAVLFDVGGPLDTELHHERLWDARLRAALAAAGVEVGDARYAEAARWAVDSFAANTYQAIVWYLTDRRVQLAEVVYAAAARQFTAPGGFELRPGIPELLAELRARGLKLGVVANQAPHVLQRLEAVGIRESFDFLGISEIERLRKPDPRLFLAVCRELGVPPAECVMVGDRIDNDIAPAAQLGMRTVLLRSGRHQDQQPRTWREVPDAEVYDTAGMRRAILALVQN
jgi:HAD superfamily hydrolase (TIGR01662 family)